MKKLYAYTDEAEKRFDEFQEQIDSGDFWDEVGALEEKTVGGVMLYLFGLMTGVPPELWSKKISEIEDIETELAPLIKMSEEVITFTRED